MKNRNNNQGPASLGFEKIAELANGEVGQHLSFDKLLIAFEAATFDEDFLGRLEIMGISNEQVFKICSEMQMDFLSSSGVDCRQIKKKINGVLKHRPRVKEFVHKYRKTMRGWIEDQSCQIGPSSFALQSLPLESGSVPAHLDFLSKILETKIDNDFVGEINDQTVPDQGKRRQLEKMRLMDGLWGGAIEEIKTLGQVAGPVEIDETPQKMRQRHLEYQLQNTFDRLGKFIEVDEKNALLVFETILNRREVQVWQHVLIKFCLKKLISNVHFVRSMLNLFLGQDGRVAKAPDKVHPAMWPRIAEALVELNFCSQKLFVDKAHGVDGGVQGQIGQNKTSPTFWRRVVDRFTKNSHGKNSEGKGVAPKKKDPRIIDVAHFSEPRTHHRIFFGDPQDGSIESCVYFPSNFVPIELMGHRLVNPNLSPAFREFGKRLDAVKLAPESKLIEESELFREGLGKQRRYAMDFDRIKIDELDEGGLDVWFHYYDSPLSRNGEIPIEIVVNGASIRVRLSNDGTDYWIVDEYENGDRWITERGLDHLGYYLVKYAYYLLVLPRSIPQKKETGASSPSDGGDGGIEFTLEENINEVILPPESGNGGMEGQKTQNKPLAFHVVKGHIRHLPEGWAASAEAEGEAHRHHIFLAPGQTYVQRHPKGKRIVERNRPEIKIRSKN